MTSDILETLVEVFAGEPSCDFISPPATAVLQAVF